MGLFDKLKEPVFYKETSDAKLQLEELKEFLLNAPEEVKEQVEQDIKMLSYGISGENNVAFELMNSSMPILILHDLHFEYEGLSAQIDYIVITKRVVIVIECKNLIGNIEVNNSGDFIRTMEFGRKKKREGIYSPITQNQRHLEVLKKIRRSDISNIIFKAIFDKSFSDNYKSVVVLANPKTIINMKFAKKEVKEQIIRCDQLIEFIKKLYKESKSETSSEKQMYELAESLLRHHTSNTVDYKKKYKVEAIENVISVQSNTVVEEVASIQNNTVVEGETSVQNNTVVEGETSVQNNTVVEKMISAQNNTVVEEMACNTAVVEKTFVQVNAANNLEDMPVYQELKQFRYIRSKEEKVKAYFIYNNVQMEEIIHLMPKSLIELKSISGFGDLKCKKYGEEILKIVFNNR